MAYSVSGASSFGDLMECDAAEVDRMIEYALNGPSEARTQLLLAQIIQLISGLTGTANPIGKLVPWFRELTNQSEDIADKRKTFMERQREAQAAAMRARKAR